MGNQDWDGVEGMVDAISERQREAGERGADLIFAPDDDEAVLALQKKMEEEDEAFEREMAKSERRAARRAQGLPSESEGEGEDEDEDEDGAGDAHANSSDALPEGWAQTEAEDGTTYYFNESTGESRWLPPGEDTDGGQDENAGEDLGEGEGEWQAMDDEAGATFYFNSTTGESRWDNPATSANA